MSFEVQQTDATKDSPTDVASAAAVANGYETAPGTTIYQGMTPAESATVANWPQPPVKCKKHKKKHGKKSAASAKKHKKSKCKKHKKKHKK